MTEVKAADGGGTAADLKGAMMGFVSELRGFRDDIQKKFTVQDERMTMLDRKTALRGRTPLSATAELEVPHQKAFNAYLRSGDDDGGGSVSLGGSGGFDGGGAGSFFSVTTAGQPSMSKGTVTFVPS